MTLRLILMAISATLPFIVLGQEIPIDIIDRINAVDYIFEGKVINSTPYKTANGKYIYTSNTIEISKVLKGDLSCGTVELITSGGKVDDLWVQPSHSLDLHKGCAGIFLAKGTNKELSAIDYYEETNYQKIEATFENQSFIKYWFDGVEWKASDVWATFQSFSEMYDLAEFVTGYNFIDCAAAPLPFTDDRPRRDQPRLASQVRRWQPHELSLLRDSIAGNKGRSQLETRGGGPEVTYGMSNVEITGTDIRYLEFDVNINDDNGGKYLHYGVVRIVYNTEVFGTSIGQTSNIDIFNGALIDGPGCYGFPNLYDLGTNDFVVFTIPTFQSVCKAQVPTTPAQLFHIRMRILDCVPFDLTMADSAFELGPSVVLYYSTYSETADDESFTEYASAVHDQTEHVDGCGPAITSFSPTTVAGGIRQILQIRGHGFGTTRGTGTVFFKNADDGGTTEVACDAHDFLQFDDWSDTLIQLYVPSVDTAIINGTAEPDMAAGSGFFRVVTNTGLSLTSPGPISISYSIVSFHLGQPKIPAFLAPYESEGGRFTFYIDSTLAAYQDGAIVPIVRKALREWTCLTGVDWVLATDSEYDSLAGPELDSVCVIKFGYLGNGTGGPLQLALATTYRQFCPPRFYSIETDVEINNYSGITWFLDTIPSNPIPAGYKDLYFALLHELGHAMNLQHLIAPSKTMHFSDNTSAGFRKIELFTDESAYAGGNWVMQQSVTAPPPVCPDGTGLINISSTSTPLCSGYYSINEVLRSFDLIFQPNPCVNSTIVTSVNGPLKSISVHDVVGKLVLTEADFGVNSTTIDLSNLGIGTYFIRANLTDGRAATGVVIKAH